MSRKIFEIYRKIISVEQLDICNIHTDGGILFLNPNNPKFIELLKIVTENKILIFNCIRENKKFYIIDIDLNKLKRFEATIFNIEKEKYTGNIHITTDPFRVIILNKNFTNHSKIYNKLRIGYTYLFLLTNNSNQLLDIKKPLKRTNYIEVSDVLCLYKEHSYLNNYVEIKIKNFQNMNVRFLYNSFLNIGGKYKITYSKSFGSNFYEITESEILI